MKSNLPAILLLLLLLAGALVSVGLPETRSDATVCVPVAERERIREVTLEGIDQGLKNHVTKLFDVWMKDTSNQPQRAVEGMSIGISAHVRARANAISWSPPPC